MLSSLSKLRSNPSVRSKILYTLAFIALYRLLVFLPVPFVNIQTLMQNSGLWNSNGLQYFAMLLWWSVDNFSLLAVGLAPFINSSIIIQLLWSVIPKLEELQEQWEVWQKTIQQYTRYLTIPLAFVQGIGMTYFINYLLGGNVINISEFWVVLLTAFVLMVGSILMMWIGELITEKGISNGTSLLIFSSIISGITSKLYTSIGSSDNTLWIILFVLIMVVSLVLLAIFIIKTIKEIPVIYARSWKVEQTSTLPFPMNPVGMVPIIFAIAFVSFPYLISQMILKFGTSNTFVANIARWMEVNFNIYTQSPGMLVTFVYFLLIIFFTFFYTMVAFNPEKISHNIQQKWGYIPGMRPWNETAQYINKILMHLCLWGGLGLAFLGVYNYILNYIPFIQNIVQSLWSVPVIVTGSWIIIIVWVVQEIINKSKADLLSAKYDQ